MKKAGIVLLVIVGAVVGYVLLVLDTAEVRHDWPDRAVSEMIEGCMASGLGSERECRCVASGYQERFSYEDATEGAFDTEVELEILERCGL